MKGVMFTAGLMPLVLDGSKTQTRRLIKGIEPDDKLWGSGQYIRGEGAYFEVSGGRKAWASPRYKPGDIVYIKEPWEISNVFVPEVEVYRAQIQYEGGACERVVSVPADSKAKLEVGKRNKMFMPAWAARYFIRILDVRAERVQDISEEDAIAEGVFFDGGPDEHGGYTHPGCSWWFHVARNAFGHLWDSIAKPGFRWADGPFVWVYGFVLAKDPKTP